MSTPAITVENLSKRYVIGAAGHSAHLRETALRLIKSPLANLKAAFSPPPEDCLFWALRDVSFEVQPGEVLGIVGRNGAGKSTLLKILSRITPPTAGRARLRGRIGSLLEVGTGFHPECTGRENIYLNGTILGMRKREIDAKFDEIVAFAEIDRFIDTPVKRYSSGMYVRLAFAVAAHLEPEILLVDEVLAVGDAEFQRKCLGKMQDVAGGGRTILFVSHNMASVSRLCTRAVFIAKGRCEYVGEVGEAVRRYLGSSSQLAAGRIELADHPRWSEHDPKIIQWVSTHTPDGEPSLDFETGGGIVIRIGYRFAQPMPTGHCQINLHDANNTRVITVCAHHGAGSLDLGCEGFVECRLDDLRLAGGDYYLGLEIGTMFPAPRYLDRVVQAVSIRMHLKNYLGGSELNPHQGVVAQRSHWTVARAAAERQT